MKASRSAGITYRTQRRCLRYLVTERYRNLTGNSGVLSVDVYETAIDVAFADVVYRYAFGTAGPCHLRQPERKGSHASHRRR